MLQKNKALLFYSLLLLLLMQSCSKTDIQFGTDLGTSYINISKVDSVGISMSTYVLDSFSNTKPSSLLVGRYKDPELGTVSAKPFLQISVPATTQITADAVYDSLTIVLKLNKAYYGDTSKGQTIQVKELNEAINYTYYSYIYNTSSFAEKTTLLGSKITKIRPNVDDTVAIRLSDVKGLDLFNKVKYQDPEVLNQDAFLNYFKGLSIGYAGTDSSMIFGITDTVSVRLYYHNSIPYPSPQVISMSTYTSGLYSNQIVSDRSATPLAALLTGGVKEIPSAAISGKAYTQSTTGVYTKLTFPTIRNVLQSDTTLKLVSATLLLKAMPSSFDLYKLWLPSSLFLVTTDGSNAIGNVITGSDGQTLYSTPVIDYLYQTPAYYSFDVTNYVNNIKTSTSNDLGLFVLTDYAGNNTNISRAVFNNSTDLTKGSQIILSFLTIKK